MMLQTARRGNARLGLPSFSEFSSKLLSKHNKALPDGIRNTLLLIATGNDVDASTSSSLSRGASDEDKKNLERVGAMTQCVNEIVEEQMKIQRNKTSEAVYTPTTLDIYDAMVWDFNSPFHWRIHRQEIDSLYQLGLKGSKRHCEVAAGTGLLLREWAKNQEQIRKVTTTATRVSDNNNNQNDVVNSGLEHLTLMDLSPSSLDGSYRRLQEEQYFRRRVSMETVQADILQPPCPTLMGSFDSVAANFLLHCLHGHSLHDKKNAIQSCASLLKVNGVFFGSTILGKDLQLDASAAGPHALATNDLYNRLGVFGNLGDTFADMASILDDLFHDVIIYRSGYCAVWLAQRPKRSDDH